MRKSTYYTKNSRSNIKFQEFSRFSRWVGTLPIHDPQNWGFKGKIRERVVQRFKFLTVRCVRRVKLHHPAKCTWVLVKPLRRYGIFSTFQDGGRRHLGWLNFQNFNSQIGHEAKLHHYAKFRADWWKCCWDVAIFHFQDGECLHPGF